MIEEILYKSYEYVLNNNFFNFWFKCRGDMYICMFNV